MKAILDHVGIAVDGLDEALEFYRSALGLAVEPPELVPAQQVRVQFIAVGAAHDGAAPKLELIEPASADSVIARYIERRGPGLHHIALRVDNVAAALAELRARGVRLVDETPRPGAHDTLVAFIHPASTRGVLVELVQHRPAAESRA